MDAPKKEKNIPIPPVKHGPAATRWIISDLAIGESRLFEYPKRKNRPDHPSQPYVAAKRLGIVITIRRVDDSHIRIWRIA